VNSIPTGDRAIIYAEHLRMLSIFHFISAGLAFVGVIFASFYAIIFQTIFTRPEIWAKAKDGPPPPEVMWIFRWIIGIILIWCLISSVGNLLSGLYLRARRHHTFSMVMAGLNCLHVPVGTALGIFTFIVLGRDSVRKLYEAERGP